MKAEIFVVAFRGSKNILAMFIFNRILVLFRNTNLCIISRVLGASTESGSSSFAGNKKKLMCLCYFWRLKLLMIMIIPGAYA